MRKNTRIIVAVIVCLAWSNLIFGQSFNFMDTTWTNNDGQPYPWRLKPRTGSYDTQGIRFPDRITKYFITDSIPGYLEFLPQGYDDPANASKLYPLLLFFPGCGEVDDGPFYLVTPTGSDLPFTPFPNTRFGLGRLFGEGGSFEALPTRCRDDGSYLSRVPVKTPGQPYNYNFGAREGFIVMSLMYRGEPALCSGVKKPRIVDVDSAILLAKSLYRVDPQRIYMTGMSQGGEQSWDYPSSSSAIHKIAAAVPVASYGKVINTAARAQRIIDNQTHILSITNLYDFNTNGTSTDVITDTEIATNTILAQPGGSSYLTILHFLYDNQPPGLSEPEVLTLKLQQHDAWYRAYPARFGDDLVRLPVYTDPVSGENFTVYEWMLLHRNNLVLLPVNVSSFTATRQNTGVELVWVTSTESNSKEFLVERSEDGNNYKPLQRLPAAGNSSTNRRYAYEDLQVPNTNFVYYRLSQLDRDGAMRVIGVKKVFIGVKGFAAKLYPTVANSTVMVDLQQSFNAPMGIRVFDASGRSLMQQTIPARTPRMQVNVSKLAKGVYFMELNNEGYRSTLKFIKD
jgi:hypothetical protein